jgi:hypothetical protein
MGNRTIFNACCPDLTGYTFPDSLSFYFDSTMLNQDRTITFISNGVVDTGTFYLIDSTHYYNSTTFNLNLVTAGEYNSDTVLIAQNWYKQHLIVDSFISMCANSSVNLSATGPSDQGLYLWINTRTNDTTYSQTATISGANLWPSPYNNICYCIYIDTSKHCHSASATTSILVKQTPTQDICVVTLDSTLSHNMLVWDKAQPTDTVTYALIDSFLILRSGNQIASQPYPVYSTYTDYSADISLQTWTYSITVVDVCGLQNNFGVSNTTIFLEQPNNGDITWYPYLVSGTPIVTTYSVLRNAGGVSNWTVLDTVSVSTSPITIHDTSSVIPPNTKYRIEAAGASCVARSAYSIYSNIEIVQPSGINNLEQGLLEVYPNPTSGIIHLTKSNLHITLSDMAGQKIIESFHSSPDIDISQLSPGVYFLTADNNSTKIVKL